MMKRGLEITRFAPGTTRPKCAYCGRLSPKDTDWLDSHAVRKLGTFKTLAELQRVVNQKVVKVSYSYDTETGARTTVWDASTWDGESYIHPFCTKTCCVKFGQAAYVAGYRIKGRA